MGASTEPDPFPKYPSAGFVCPQCSHQWTRLNGPLEKRPEHCPKCEIPWPEERAEDSPMRGNHRAQETVNHPLHYGGDVPHEVYKCLRVWGLEGDALLWNAVKYIARAGKKDPAKKLEDLEKALWYLQNRIDQIKGPKT